MSVIFGIVLLAFLKGWQGEGWGCFLWIIGIFAIFYLIGCAVY